MLSAQEQRVWDEIERRWAEEADREGLPAAVIGGGWGAVLLVLFGVPWAGLAVGTAVTLLWLLWRYLPQLQRAGIAADPTGEPAGRPMAQRSGDLR